MGCRASRQTDSNQKSNRSKSPKQPTHQQKLLEQHMNLHYNEVDKVVNQHLNAISTNSAISALTKDIHQNSLKIAMKQHMQAASLNNPNYYQIEHMVYDF